MRKLRLVLALAIALAAGLGGLALAEEPQFVVYHGLPVVTILIDGQELACDVPAVVLDGRTFVPLRSLMEALDARVDWDPVTGTVTVKTTAPDAEGPAVTATTTTEPGAAVTFDPATADDYNAARGEILTAYALACTAAHQEYAAAWAAVISQLPGDDQLAARNEAIGVLEAARLQALADAAAARDAALADLKAMYGSP